MNPLKVFGPLFAAVTLIAAAQPVSAQEGKPKSAAGKSASGKSGAAIPEKTLELAKKFVVVSGQEKTMVDSVAATIEASRKTETEGLPEGFWDEFEKEFNKSVPELVEALAPIYAKNYTDEELEALIEFYSSPVGQKLVEKQAVVVAEATKVGAAHGERLGREVAEKLMKNN